MDFSRLTSYLDSLSENYGIPYFDLIVTENRGVIYRHMGGIANREAETPVSPDTIYDFYSATKVITAAAVMQLIEQGRLSPQDRLASYLPEFEHMRVADHFDPDLRPMRWPTRKDSCHDASSAITIGHLLSMRAGLNYDIFSSLIRKTLTETEGTAGTQDIVRTIAEAPLIFEPGHGYAYSFAFDVLGAVVEKVSGERYADYLAGHIFQPLGIKNLYMHLPPEMRPRRGDCYARDRCSGQITRHPGDNVYRLTENFDSGGAGICGTVEDYAVFLQALACGGVGSNGARILQGNSVKEMAVPRLSAEELRQFNAGNMHLGYSYGYGVRTLIDETSALSPLGEFGWDGAAGAYALVDPKNHISIFYAQQVLGMINAYTEIHPRIRDLVYSCRFSDTHSG